MHRPAWNLSGTHTEKVPSGFVGMPSAPGYVPKYWSKLRFACTMKIRCWSSWIPLASVTEVVGDDGVIVDFLDVRVHETATTLIATRANAARRTTMAAESIGGSSRS